VLKFFEEANYIVKDPLVLLYTNEELVKIYKEDTPNWYDYNAIETINSQQFESIAQTKFKNGEEGWLTTQDILSARKYVYDSRFKPNVSECHKARFGILTMLIHLSWYMKHVIILKVLKLF